MTPEMHPVPVNSPWHHIRIDFIGPIAYISPSGTEIFYFSFSYAQHA